MRLEPPLRRLRTTRHGALLAAPGVPLAALEEALREHAEVAAGPRLLKSNLGTRVTRVRVGPTRWEGAPEEMVVKEVPVPLRRRIGGWLGLPSRFCEEFEKVASLERLGARSARPVACSLRSSRKTELLLSEFLEGTPLRDLLWLGPGVLSRREDLEALLEPLGGWLRRLHDRGVWQRDMKPSNVLLAPGADAAGAANAADAAEAAGAADAADAANAEDAAGRRPSPGEPLFFLIDVTAVRLAGRPLDRARRVRNLSQLLDLTRALDDVAREPLLRGYTGGAGEAELETWLADVDRSIEARRAYRQLQCGQRHVDEEHAARHPPPSPAT